MYDGVADMITMESLISLCGLTYCFVDIQVDSIALMMATMEHTTVCTGLEILSLGRELLKQY